MPVRLGIALLASSAVVLGAPFVGEIRAAIQRALPGQYRYVIGGTVALAVTLAVAAAVVRIRERRWLRYGLLAAALTAAAVYALTMRTGNPDVDAVELFHFVQYGLIAFLFYRVWAHCHDVTTIVLPVLAGITVGVLDEAFQWLIPYRVGELHDVLLNGVAIACGVVFSLGLDLPRRLALLPEARARVILAAMTTIVAFTTALFFHVVHLGSEVNDADIGTFRSRFSAQDLLEAAQSRRAQWQSAPPVVARRVAREDQYLAEGLWHVQRRNQVMTTDTRRAWKENLILEKYFAPVLEFPSYGTPSGARWPDEQRANVAAAAAADSRPFASDAHPHPIYTWSPTGFWSVVALVVAVVVAGCLRPLRLRGSGLPVTVGVELDGDGRPD